MFRKYLRFGKELAYQPEEEIVYDDAYKRPISEILSGRKTLTIPQVKSKLDNNGYYGRCSVKRVYKNGCYPLNQVRIHVNLIWSQVNYVWPYKGVFSLDDMRVLRDPNVPDVSTAARALRSLYSSYGGGVHTLRKKSGMSLEHSEMAMNILSRTGAVRGFELMITDDLDLEEFINNVLK